MRQVIRMPEPKVRTEVGARQGIEGAVVFRVPVDPTVDILTSVGPSDLPGAAER